MRISEVTALIELKNLSKTFNQGTENEVVALKNINITINDGDIFGIIGLSGAGKSTLIRCVNYLEKPTGGSVIFDGIDLGSISEKELLETRRHMSMIFQNFNLLSQQTAIKNVCFPMEISGVPKNEAKKRATELLTLVGLGDKLDFYPAQLSGGQKQRVAIARALTTNPRVLLCDEVTSALDPNTTRSILELLQTINKTMGVTIIMITHEMKVIEQICNKVAVLDHSEIVEMGNVKDIFLAPKSKIARELILPKSEGVDSIGDGGIYLRLVFDGTTAFEPVISNLALECRAAVNILAANTKNIEGKAYGQMVLQLPTDKSVVERIENYLDKKGIVYKEEDSYAE